MQDVASPIFKRFINKNSNIVTSTPHISPSAPTLPAGGGGLGDRSLQPGAGTPDHVADQTHDTH